MDLEPQTWATSDGVPVEVTPDTTLRVKIIDTCGLACTFCHNEGTPVTADNLTRGVGNWVDGSGPTTRRSIYVSSNGANFLAAPVLPDAQFTQTLSDLRSTLGFTEVHFTGGEPTLHPQLTALVGLANREGFRVAITTNGENGSSAIPGAHEAGLDRINLSVFGTTAGQLAQIQAGKYSNSKLAERKISAMEETIRVAHNCGVRVNANIVLPDETHIPRVFHLLDRFGDAVSIRLLNSLSDGQASLSAIAQILERLQAKPVKHRISAGASGYKTEYSTPSHGSLQVKKIRQTRLDSMCRTCTYNRPDLCEEGFYGVRLYKSREGHMLVGVCLQRMDLTLPVADFLASQRPQEILRLRAEELAQPANYQEELEFS